MDLSRNSSVLKKENAVSISKSPQRKLSIRSNNSSKTESTNVSPRRNSINLSLSPRIDKISVTSNNSIPVTDDIKYNVRSPKINSPNINKKEEVSTPVRTLNTILSPEQISQNPPSDNIEKISMMSKILTNEANALSNSIKNLSDDVTRTHVKLGTNQDDPSGFPYHLFLIEIVVNKIQMKCECFEPDHNNLVITYTFLGKKPVVLYDSSCGALADFTKLNVGKSSLFAMTYDKICSIQDFIVDLELLKQPPCSHCITKLAETHMDYTKEFITIRQDLCKKWTLDQPKDDIICTSSSPMHKNQFYLTCGEEDNAEVIGIIEVSLRMSFLGKEITTVFSSTSKSNETSLLVKEDNGISMYACQNVEMDESGKILLDENTCSPTRANDNNNYLNTQNSHMLHASHGKSTKNYQSNSGLPKYDEIYTKMNSNELKIRVPKSNKIEQIPKYDRINELCICESHEDNAGEQVQFELPHDLCNPNRTHNTYTSNLKYTYKGCNKTCESTNRDKKIINVTPTNCPASVSMEKMIQPGKDVFILKIGKKLETKDKKTDLEIELITPQAPGDKLQRTNAALQCSSTCNSLKSKSSKLSVKKSTKKGKKKKGKSKDSKKHK